jgi:anti-anti-sigma regulatory factor
VDGRNAVCCDLGRARFFGAAAADTLFAAHRRATEREHTFFLRGVHGFTARVLTLVDPDRVLTRLP